MPKPRPSLPIRHLSGALLSATLLTGGLGGLTVGTAGVAGADNSGQQICGPSVPITSSTTATAPATLTVPQYNGTAALTTAVLSLQATQSYSGAFRQSAPPYSPFPGTGTNDFVGVTTVLEASGPGLGALSPVTIGAVFKGTGFDSFTAGDPPPTLPAGVATATATNADGVGTGAATPSSWTTLGFPFAANSPSPATATGTSSFTLGDGSIPPASFGAYTGTGTVAIDAADYSSDSVSSDSTGFNGASVTTSLSACVTYSVLGVQTPEVPSTLLLPASAGAVGLGAFMIARRRRSRSSAH